MIVFGTPQQRSQLPPPGLTFGGEPLAQSECVKDLGVWLDCGLTFSNHVDEAVNKCRRALGQVSRVRHLMDRKTAKIVVESLALSHLDYCASLLGGTSKENLTKMQRAMNYGAKVVMMGRKFDAATPLLKELQWLPISARIESRELTLMRKILLRIAPEGLHGIARPVPDVGHRTRQRDVGMLDETTYRLDTARSGFEYRMTRKWNSLPDHLKEAPTMGSFKARLAKWELTKSF